MVVIVGIVWYNIWAGRVNPAGRNTVRIYNTSKLPIEELEPLIRFAARGVVDSRVVVKCKRGRRTGPHGCCYYFGFRGEPITPNIPIGTRALITMHLPDPTSTAWPMKWGNNYRLVRLGKMYPHVPFESWADFVVYLTAHEFRHVWQADRSRRMSRAGKVASGKGEHDAEKHGIKMLSRWRVQTGRTPIAQVKQENPFKKAACR